MKTLLSTCAILLSLAAPALANDEIELRDYTNKSITCDKEEIKERLGRMIENSAYGRLRGVKLLYLKGDVVEVGRSKDELKCRIDARTTDPSDPWKGIFRYHNTDGHALVGFKPSNGH
ncbi:hypothetical protein [Bradyrhizobium sp. MOS002]|uniref:hypothetical protein n=1 Tax=Bradyrhizobium sp. MOS002 TaxID=2133947 RepID=UPI000D1341D0|nr:hypothetical protein [Bradyrhizobium sp. MOS002]PSO33418.1 hypothetical protein C7G41_00055 [Bradyrhizobium sp. MOS002]